MTPRIKPSYRSRTAQRYITIVTSKTWLASPHSDRQANLYLSIHCIYIDVGVRWGTPRGERGVVRNPLACERSWYLNIVGIFFYGI